jgi:hypothetical protein
MGHELPSRMRPRPVYPQIASHLLQQHISAALGQKVTAAAKRPNRQRTSWGFLDIYSKMLCSPLVHDEL